jgi:3-hydroxybutyrate dehydrogenase
MLVAASGIGLGIARILVARGADIMMNGFGNASQIDRLRGALASEFGIRVHCSGADIIKPGDIAEMVEQAQEELGSLDILRNNAGIQFTRISRTFPRGGGTRS